MARKREFDIDEVIEKAMMLFWQQGYEATTMRGLQKQMGISGSSMYETFRDKRSIFLLALERYCMIELEQIRDLAQRHPKPRDFVSALFSSVNQMLPQAAQNYGSMTFNTMAEFGMRDADISERLFKHFVAITEIIAEVLEQSQTKDTAAAHENPIHIAHFIVSNIQGLATIKSVKPDYPYSDSFQQLVLKVLNP